MKRFLLVLLLVILLSWQALAQAPLRIGLMGDSQTDEYRANDNRGGTYSSVTFNWIEQLVDANRLDAGTWGSRSEPRRIGYNTNWARSGAIASTLISSGQHTGLAAQVAAGQIDVIFLGIGANDFAPYNGVYQQIYDGSLSGSALQAKINTLVANITTALDTARGSTTTPAAIATIGNWSNSPLVLLNSSYPDPAKRQRVSDAITAVNNGISNLVAARSNVSLIDLDAFQQGLFAQVVNGVLPVGGVNINLLACSNEPHAGALGDCIHGGTVLEGLIANFYLAVIDPNAAPLSTNDILAAAGLYTPPQPTATPTNIPTITPTLQPTLTPTNAPTLTPTLAATSTPQSSVLTLQITNGVDDVNEFNSTLFASSSPMWLGNGGTTSTSYTGLRFNNVVIPQGATITAAHIEVRSSQSQWIILALQFAAEAANTSAVFSTSSRPSQRSLTAARVNHSSNVSWANGAWYILNDISAVIQEVINRPGWQSGNALSLIVKGTGGNWSRKFISAFESNPAYAIRLVITLGS